MSAFGAKTDILSTLHMSAYDPKRTKSRKSSLRHRQKKPRREKPGPKRHNVLVMDSSRCDGPSEQALHLLFVNGFHVYRV
jgi:hypothetical protein